MTCPARPRARRDDGTATAEAATVLPALVIVLSLCLGVLLAVGAQLRCADAASTAARLAARGESAGAVRAQARAVLPGSTVTLARHGDQVEVRVEHAFRPTRWLPSIRLRASAQALLEQP